MLDALTERLALAPSAPRFEAPPRIIATLSGDGGGRASFPLRLSQANTYVRPRLALIGDAAHSVHPLAGQGLNLGLGDAEVLAEELEAGAGRGADFGALGSLRRYETRRRGHNAAMMMAADTIKCLFALPASVGGAGADVSAPGRLALPIAALRGLGLSLVNAVRPAARLVERIAKG